MLRLRPDLWVSALEIVDVSLDLNASITVRMKHGIKHLVQYETRDEAHAQCMQLIENINHAATVHEVVHEPKFKPS